MLATLLKTVVMIGSDLPAYKALFDDLVAMMGEEDQQAAKDAYVVAMERAKAAHRAAEAI